MTSQQGFHFPNQGTSTRQNRRGSTLLLTLMMVSLLMVIVLSFVTFVRIELRSVVQKQNQRQARANARLGAQMALARLQETAGLDTRVTLPAGADASVAALQENRMWTGVRDSAPFRTGSSGTLEVNPGFSEHLAWLISSPAGTTPRPDQSNFQAPFLPASQYALLVGPGSVQTAGDAVAAPAVPLMTQTGDQLGCFAFWVGDEASKSQINLSDPFRSDGDSTTDPWRAMTIQRSGTEAFLDLYDPDDPAHDQMVGRALMPGQLKLLNLSTENLNTFFHDISLSSYGLPTNSKRGGLKRDLTPVFQETANNGGVPSGSEYDALLAFQEERIERLRAETLALPSSNPGFPEHVWNAMNAITLRDDQANAVDRTQIYPPFSDMTVGNDVGGPAWSQLLSWATLTSRSGNSDLSLQTGRNSSTTFNPLPVIARYNLAVYWSMDFPKLRLHFVPTVVLWNPYDRVLKGKDYTIKFTYSPQHLRGYKLNFRMRNPAWKGGDSFWTPQYRVDPKSWKWGVDLNLKLAAEDLPPGAAVIFSMPHHEELATDSSGYTGRNSYVTLEPGYFGGGGYSFYIEQDDFNANIIAEADAYRKTYSTAWNSWDRAGLPLFFEDPDNPGQADPAHDGWNLLPYANRLIGLNVNGIDPAQGWEIVETVTSFTRNPGDGDTKLLEPSLQFYPGDPGWAKPNSTKESSQPYIYLRELHGTVPHNLHKESVSSGIFPGMPGPPPSFPGDSTPFRPDIHSSFPLWGISWGLRVPDTSYRFNTAEEGAGAHLNAPIAWLAHYNPASPFQYRSGVEADHYFGHTEGYGSIPTYIGGFTLDPDYFDLSSFSDDDKHYFIGHSDGVPGGFAPGDIPRAVLFTLPNSPNELTSPAALAAMPIESHGSPSTHNIGGKVGSRAIQQRIHAGNLQPTYPIGNSLAHPLVHPDQAVRTYFPTGSGPSTPPRSIPYSSQRYGHSVGGFPRPYAAFMAQYDSSWVLNELLWDDFLFTPDSNSRLRWTGGTPDRGFDLSGQNVTVEGAFNVNSTSVVAWKSLLLGMLDVDLTNTSGETESHALEERLPFSRTASPYGAAYSPANGDLYDNMSNYMGYRRLSLDEVDLLAEAIVDEVASRGPFLSMADFVNRRLLTAASDPDDHRLKGALQAAIDKAGLNDSQENPADDASTIELTDFQGEYAGESHFTAMHHDALPGPTSRGAPGYFTQADVLARIGSVLQTRSDTFVIRAYGDSGNPDNPDARAWCELLVRRHADYIDPADPPERHPDQALPVNQLFGRRFEIIRFRWLAKGDI